MLLRLASSTQSPSDPDFLWLNSLSAVELVRPDGFLSAVTKRLLIVYSDSYALYLNDPHINQTITQHPDWFLYDSNGNKLYIDFACSGGTCTQYAANITDPNGFRANWIANVATALNRTPSYKGIWVDDVNLDLNGHISDGNGQSVTPIDPQTGSPMTNEAWRTYFADFMEQIRAAFPAVEIVHNDIYFTNNCDPTDSQIQREIRSADFLNMERGVNDSGLTGGNGCFSYDSMLAFIDKVHGNGRGVAFDAENSDTLDDQEYSVASYLLISTGKDLVGDDQETPTHWWTGFQTDLGAAQTGRYAWNSLLRRDFAGGMALVNPPGGSTMTVSLPGTFHQVDGTAVTSVTLSAAHGVVLLASLSAATPSAAPGAGSYLSSQRITLASTTPGAQIYYTTDGTFPTTASTLYSAPIIITVTSTVKAIAVASGFNASAETEASYSITVPVAVPVVNAIKVYPDPWQNSRHASRAITFSGLSSGTTITIFTVSGHRVKELHSDGPLATWNLTTESGGNVASGIYLYAITDSQARKVQGKLAIIR